MSLEPIELGKPGPTEALVRNTAIGLNFLDVYHRNGLYPQPLPFTPGHEGAGVIEAVGSKVKGLRVGDRVGYVGPIGAYAEHVLRPAEQLIKLPRELDDQTVAASMLKGMTAEYLLRRTYQVKKGDLILVHAAAGGVGQILCQWAKALGAVVIAVVGSREKAKLVKAKHVIVTSEEDWVARVKQITKGKGVRVVYDSVGKDTFLGSLDCLQPRGLMVSYGNASGPVDEFKPALLSQKGSLFLTRPTLFTYTASRDELLLSARALFKVLKSGAVKLSKPRTYALKDAAQAHRDLEARKTTGSVLLLP